VPPENDPAEQPPTSRRPGKPGDAPLAPAADSRPTVPDRRRVPPPETRPDAGAAPTARLPRRPVPPANTAPPRNAAPAAGPRRPTSPADGATPTQQRPAQPRPTQPGATQPIRPINRQGLIRPASPAGSPSAGGPTRAAAPATAATPDEAVPPVDRGVHRRGGLFGRKGDDKSARRKEAGRAQAVRTEARRANPPVATDDDPARRTDGSDAASRHLDPDQVFARLAAATAHLEPPFAVLDRAAFRANAVALSRRAAGMPIRMASKSLRCRTPMIEAMSLDGFAGVLGYSLAEAIWLTGDDAFRDVVVAYPTADRTALARLVNSEVLAERVTLMVDSIDHLDLIDSVAKPGRRPTLRVCIDMDASLRSGNGRLHIGVRRSPIHTPADAAVIARRIGLRPGFEVAGLMSYEAQIAGLGDAPPGRFWRGAAIRWMQRRSWKELVARRGAVVDAVRSSLAQVGASPPSFINAGGTGSIERTITDPVVTEVAAGSGLFGPTLFDAYRAFTPRPAALFALPVTRRPARGWVTVAGGGWVASGPPGTDRLPTPVYPPGLSYAPTEGAGEVQTPLHGEAADLLNVGDRVWFRHAKAGELSEHVDVLHIVDGNRIVDVVPTYRGEGKVF
jgi:D-serine deaminase-like pyridoxal phosphate-dependent protein